MSPKTFCFQNVRASRKAGLALFCLPTNQNNIAKFCRKTKRPFVGRMVDLLCRVFLAYSEILKTVSLVAFADRIPLLRKIGHDVAYRARHLFLRRKFRFCLSP